MTNKILQNVVHVVHATNPGHWVSNAPPPMPPALTSLTAVGFYIGAPRKILLRPYKTIGRDFDSRAATPVSFELRCVWQEKKGAPPAAVAVCVEDGGMAKKAHTQTHNSCQDSSPPPLQTEFITSGAPSKL